MRSLRGQWGARKREGGGEEVVERALKDSILVDLPHLSLFSISPLLWSS
jgi:hypothetical protein